MPHRNYRSELIALDQAPEAIAKLHRWWSDARVNGDAMPLKATLNPFELKGYLGRVCILEIQHDPLDFIYRLDGSEISAACKEDLSGRSVRLGEPRIVYENHFEEFTRSYHAAKPQVWHIRFKDHFAEKNYLRLVLPYSRGESNGGGQSAGPDYFLTYSHSLTSEDGSFEGYRRLSSPRSTNLG